jgi:hypothetical protein
MDIQPKSLAFTRSKLEIFLYLISQLRQLQISVKDLVKDLVQMYIVGYYNNLI